MATTQQIRQHWDSEPCGTRDIPYPVGSFAYYEAISDRRNKREPYIEKYAQFERWSCKKVLEVGCGTGSDLIRFAQAGAEVVGIDLSPHSVALAEQRLRIYKCLGMAMVADAECIPYKDNYFDFCWSWGVAHHSVNPQRVVNEMHRVVKHGGQVRVMLYHKPSLVTLQVWLAFGLMKGNLSANIDELLANYHESPGTKAYTVEQARELFSSFTDVKIEKVVTSYDLRYYPDRFLPLWLGKIIPKGLGWNIVVKGMKS